MPVSPTGIASKPLDYLRESLAASSTFQTWTGAADATAAKAFVHYVSTDTLTLPRAVINWGGTQEWESDAGGSRLYFEQTGELKLDLWGSVSDSGLDAESDEALTFMNNVGGVLADLFALAGTGGYLEISSARLGPPMRPERSEEATDGDFHLCEVFLTYRSHT